MKKIFGIMVIMSLTLFVAATGFAEIDLTSAANEGIEEAVTGVNGVNTFAFAPSPQVLTTGKSWANAFTLGAMHAQALETTGGKEYGMAYDSTKVYWLDVGYDGASFVAIADSNSLVFSDWNY